MRCLLFRPLLALSRRSHLLERKAAASLIMSGPRNDNSSSAALPALSVVQPFDQSATTTTSSLTRQISPLIVYRRAPSSPAASPPRNLVLLFAWIFSRDAHLERYRHFWTSRGYDIVTIQTTIRELAFPGSIATPNGQKVLQFLADESQYRQIVIHGFSIGTYALFNFIDQLLASDDLTKRCANSIRGLIIDSATVTHDFHTGVANTLAKNPSLRAILQKLCYCYGQVSGLLTGHLHARIGRVQEENPLNLPALMLYSRDDEIVAAHFISELIQTWRKKDIQVWEKCWQSSPHVAHFKNHPEEYSAEVDQFLRNIGLHERKES